MAVVRACENRVVMDATRESEVDRVGQRGAAHSLHFAAHDPALVALGEDVQQGGLARAAAAQQGHHLAWP